VGVIFLAKCLSIVFVDFNIEPHTSV